MGSNKNNYRPETEFEKEKFAELINNIMKAEDEKVSDEFDDKFFAELQNVKPPVTVKLNMIEPLQSFLSLHRVKVYGFAAATAVILLLIITLPFKETFLPEKILTQKDSAQTDLDTGTIKNHDLITQENITTPNDQMSKTQSSKIKETLYWNELVKNLDQKYGLALSKKNNPSKLIREIAEGELFKKSIENKKSSSRNDTLKLLLQLIQDAKK